VCVICDTAKIAHDALPYVVFPPETLVHHGSDDLGAVFAAPFFVAVLVIGGGAARRVADAPGCPRLTQARSGSGKSKLALNDRDGGKADGRFWPKAVSPLLSHRRGEADVRRHSCPNQSIAHVEFLIIVWAHSPIRSPTLVCGDTANEAAAAVEERGGSTMTTKESARAKTHRCFASDGRTVAAPMTTGKPGASEWTIPGRTPFRALC
jgi:hypothetical protein